MMCYHGYRTDNGQGMRMLPKTHKCEMVFYVDYRSASNAILKRPMITAEGYKLAHDMIKRSETLSSIADVMSTTRGTLINAMRNYENNNRSSESA